MPKSKNDELVEAIRVRSEKQTGFNGGIITADRYLNTLQECIGSDACYKFAASRNNSFNDQVKRAANVLTYNNDEMIVDELVDFNKEFNVEDMFGVKLILPKNCLLVVRHVLTSPKKDRDGDVLRSQGARLDPKMLLLFQHTHALPIGKMLGIAEHNKNRIVVYSAVVDMNELSHDSAVMIDNDMGRFSHGFRALDFTEVKEDRTNGKTTSPGGFDIKEFEVMEESLVSVPSNTDAQTEEVMWSLISSRKLTSPLMKSYGKTIQAKRPTSLNIPYSASDEEEEQNGDETTTETKSKTAGTKCGCGGHDKPAPEKADDSDPEEKSTDDKKVMKCPECGADMTHGVCVKCGYGKTETEKSEKAGRTISSKNLNNLTKARDHMHEIHEKEHLMSRGGKSMCKEAHGLLDEVIKSAEREETVERSVELTVKDAMSFFLSEADQEQRSKMFTVLKTMQNIDVQSKQTESVQALLGKQ